MNINFLKRQLHKCLTPDATTGRCDRKQAIPQPVMFVFVVLSMTSVIGYRFYNQPQLTEGTIAPTTVTAERDLSVEDRELTEEQRKAAQTGLIPILKQDPAITQETQQQLEQFLLVVDQLREEAGPLPFAEGEVLSLSTQIHLRQMDNRQWQQFLRELEVQLAQPALLAPSAVVPSDKRTPTQTLPTQQAIVEVERYSREQGEQPQIALLETVNVARVSYQRALDSLQRNPDLTEAQQDYAQALLDLREESWQATREGLRLGVERILMQGLPPGLPAELTTQAVQVQLRSAVPETVLPDAVSLVTGLLQPNLVPDKDGTKAVAEQAAESVEPVVYEVKKGEVIVQEGDEITRRGFVLLDEMDASLRRIDWQGLISTGTVVIAAVGLFSVMKRRLGVRLRCRDRVLLCLLSLSTPLFMQLGQYNLVAVGLLGSSFYSPALAVTHVSLLTGLAVYDALPWRGLTSKAPWESLIAGATGGLVAAIVAGRLRSREEVALLGGTIAIAQGTAFFVVTLIWSAAAGTIWSLVFPEAAMFGLSGLAWCVIALGISPYLERLFDLVTPIRLAELSNPNRPLLKRLATEAPGTFQHTLFVASLAEAAARELHCNVELVRAGTLYHDIGKMHDPLGFIENQMGGPNKHEKINDPWRSADIIKKHVSEGLVMARRYNLPQAIRDFIPEHQGTILISYFYFQAKERAAESHREVQEQDFRYDGPIPQSRETGIVMLADACEAALRSLKEATPETALSMIKKIFRARWQDQQLEASGLRREELTIIAEVFVRVWQQYNHQRIVYPKAALDAPSSSPVHQKTS